MLETTGFSYHLSKDKSLEEMKNELTAIEEGVSYLVTCYSATIDNDQSITLPFLNVIRKY